MDWKFELIVVPVTDVDRAKEFYVEHAGFTLDFDHADGDFRVVQLTPKGSSCSIALMRRPEAAGTLQELHLVVADVDEARSALVGRGMKGVSEVFHFASGRLVPGPDPRRSNYNSFVSFNDPDGNGWVLQEVRKG